MFAICSGQILYKNRHGLSFLVKLLRSFFTNYKVNYFSCFSKNSDQENKNNYFWEQNPETDFIWPFTFIFTLLLANIHPPVVLLKCRCVSVIGIPKSSQAQRGWKMLVKKFFLSKVGGLNPGLHKKENSFTSSFQGVWPHFLKHLFFGTPFECCF